MKLEKQQPKIILITDYWFPIKSGIATYVYNLYFNLKNRGLRTSIIFSKGSISEDSIKIDNRNTFSYLVNQYKYLIKYKPAIIHTNGPGYMSVGPVIYKILHPSVKLFHTHHTDLDKEKKGYFKRVCFGWIYSKYDQNIFVSNYLLKKYSIYEIQSDEKVIYGAAEKINFKHTEYNSFLKRHHIDNKDVIVSYIGNFSFKQKSRGVIQLIKAMPNVIKLYPRVKLLIIGDGKYLFWCKEIVSKLNLNSHVIYCGLVNNVYMPLKRSDIHTHLTYQDAFPLTIIEGMLSKTPIIASKKGGIPEIIKDKWNGLIINNNGKEIEQALRLLLDNKMLRKEIIHNAYKDVTKNYNWNKITNEYIKSYNLK